ncbi:uncharacterized protein LOC115311732 [Ixodes scapularis]|uniref:uncharacterized protein LOC115311732 n=1 Tax=Ixodes scapularis TaxID=6945 RepID=UPI001C37FA7C|nr:uncharacterized protein LOC115311732 [Ixodes scapularis]
MGSGLYHYFGVAAGLMAEATGGLLPSGCSTLSLSINVDGLPISQSSRKQFWPVLVPVKESRGKNPFVAALHEGDGKPENVELFMKDFVEELSVLLTQGIHLNSKLYTVQLHSFICDAPARAYLKCIKGQTAYYGSEKCSQKGKHDGKKVTLPDIDAPLCTDEDFTNQVNADHHHAVSPLSALGVGLVSCFPLDYMHLVCLGVMKRLIVQYWTSPTPSASKLPKRQYSLCSVKDIKCKCVCLQHQQCYAVFPQVHLQEMYYIINFLGKNDISAVPACWVRNDRCAWPPYRGKQRTKAIKDFVPLVTAVE